MWKNNLISLLMILITASIGYLGDKEPSHSIYKEGEVIVKLKSEVKKQGIQKLQSAGFHPLRLISKRNIYLMRIPEGLSVEEAIKRLRGFPEIEYAEPNYIVKKASLPNDLYFSLQWALNNEGQTVNGFTGLSDADIDGPEAWDICRGSQDIVVAVIDTGIDYNHPDIEANIWRNIHETCNDGIDNDNNGYVDDCIGWNFAYKNNDPMDDDGDGHGTHVAGIIGAVGNNAIGVSGVNWAIRLMPLKFLSSDGTGYMADVLEAIEYAIDNGARFINASYTYPQSCVRIFPSQLERNMIRAAGERGILFVAAAGNYGCNNDRTPFYPASHPLDNIISVAASDMKDSLTWWSNYGLNSVHVAAPGFNIYSTIRRDLKGYGNIYGYDFMSGTSMATPFVSGLSALIMSCRQGLSHLDVKELVLSSVDQKQDFIDKTVSGGRINAYNALTQDLIPVRPTGLSISNNQGSVTLSWQDNSSIEDGFIIERKEGLNNLYWEIARLGANIKTYQDQSAIITEGKAYYYRVRAYNSKGYSIYSNEAGISVPPNAPSGLQAYALSGSEIRLSWIDNSSVEDGYIIERRTDTSAWSRVGSTGSNETEYIDRGLSPSTLYYYRVKAYSSTGESGYSNEVSVKTLESSSNKGSGCFIATAAYGSYLAPEVEVLREFRDKWLLEDFRFEVASLRLEIPNYLGRAFVRFYYRVSPPVAEYISRHEGLRAVTRFALTPVVYTVKYPYFAFFIALVALSVYRRIKFK